MIIKESYRKQPYNPTPIVSQLYAINYNILLWGLIKVVLGLQPQK